MIIMPPHFPIVIVKFSHNGRHRQANWSYYHIFYQDKQKYLFATQANAMGPFCLFSPLFSTDYTLLPFGTDYCEWWT